MHALLVPFGSHGDLHPFIGLGQALRARGHRVTFVINEYFGPLVRGLGFDMAATGPAELFEQAMRDPALWEPRKAFGVIARNVVEWTRIAYPILADLHEPGETIAVGGSLGLAVRIAQEKLGLPAATVHLQPGVLHSNHETPAYPKFTTPRWWPRWLRRAFFNWLFGSVVDPQIAPPLNAYRAELGLPPVRRVLTEWLHSPELVLGFFPEWFGPPQPDWPRPLRLVGFPLYDEADATPMPAGLDAFLAAGPPPVAFTPGSANLHGRAFFEAAVDACRRLGRRGLLLTRFPEQLPADLPEGVIHCAYAPFGRLLPRVAALVHHGGVGTSAQGMASGVPQLVMPLAHDQYDNAARMARLGVARAVPPERFRGPAVAEALRALLESPEVASSCRAVAARFDPDARPMEAACDALEALIQPAAARA